MDAPTTTLPKPAPKRVEPVLVILFVFFLLIFVANGVLIYLSQSSWNGLVVRNYYEEGEAYTSRMNEQRAQEARGWRGELDLAQLVVGKPAAVRFTFADASGRPISGAQVSGVLYRPVQETQDLPFTLDEISPGVYSNRLIPSSPGHWGVKLTAMVRGETYRQHTRIFLTEAALGR